MSVPTPWDDAASSGTVHAFGGTRRKDRIPHLFPLPNRRRLSLRDNYPATQGLRLVSASLSASVSASVSASASVHRSASRGDEVDHSLGQLLAAIFLNEVVRASDDGVRLALGARDRAL